MRDRLRSWLESTLKSPFFGQPAAFYLDQTKSYYHGALSQTALEEKNRRFDLYAPAALGFSGEHGRAGRVVLL